MEHWLSINGVISYDIFSFSDNNIELFEPLLSDTVLKGVEGNISTSKYYIFKELNQSSLCYAFSGDIRLPMNKEEILDEINNWLQNTINKPELYIDLYNTNLTNQLFNINLHSSIFEFFIDEYEKYIIQWDKNTKQFYILKENEFLKEILLLKK